MVEQYVLDSNQLRHQFEERALLKYFLLWDESQYESQFWLHKLSGYTALTTVAVCRHLAGIYTIVFERGKPSMTDSRFTCASLPILIERFILE